MAQNINTAVRRSFPAIFLVLLAGIIVYGNTFHVPFTFDDRTSIVDARVLVNLDNFFSNSNAYDNLPNRYIAFLSFALNYYFDGYNVIGYHIVNLFIHLTTALLVYGLLRLTFRTPYFRVFFEYSESDSLLSQSGIRFSAFVPLFAALLFVVHPVQTQAVTYVVQRMTSMAAMFYLLSIYLYVRGRLSIEQLEDGVPEREGKTSSTIFSSFSLSAALLFTGSVFAAVLAMKTKENTFTLPLVAILYELFFFRGYWSRRVLYLLPLLATLPIVPMTYIDLGVGGEAGDIPQTSGDILSDTVDQLRVGTELTRLSYLFTQFRVIVTYLRLLVLPINQNLDYDYPIYSTFFTPPVFLSFLLLTLIFAAAVYLFFATRPKSRASGRVVDPILRLVSFGILWFFLALSVESTVVPIVDVIMEHRLYLPSFGAVTAFASVYCFLAGKFFRSVDGKLFFFGAAVLVLILGFAAFQRNHLWGDSIRLWQDVVNKSPNKGRALNNLGVAFEEAGQRQEAFNAFSRGIAVAPAYYKSYYNLADLYLVSDQPEAALPLLQTLIRLKPDFTEAYVSIGAALMRSGQFRQMAFFLEKNLERVKGERGEGEARFYLGAAYAFLGKREAALRELQIVSRFDPQLAANLAGLLGLKTRHTSSASH